MSQEWWTSVATYFDDLLVPSDSALQAALADSNAAELPPANVAPNQGQFLQLLAQIQRARTILEIGTLGGYSTIWLAQALPEDGHLITLEAIPKHAEVARVNLTRPVLANLVEVRLGPAIEPLSHFMPEWPSPFDFIFIDA